MPFKFHAVLKGTMFNAPNHNRSYWMKRKQVKAKKKLEKKRRRWIRENWKDIVRKSGTRCVWRSGFVSFCFESVNVAEWTRGVSFYPSEKKQQIGVRVHGELLHSVWDGPPTGFHAAWHGQPSVVVSRLSVRLRTFLGSLYRPLRSWPGPFSRSWWKRFAVRFSVVCRSVPFLLLGGVWANQSINTVVRFGTPYDIGPTYQSALSFEVVCWIGGKKRVSSPSFHFSDFDFVWLGDKVVWIDGLIFFNDFSSLWSLNLFAFEWK